MKSLYNLLKIPLIIVSIQIILSIGILIYGNSSNCHEAGCGFFILGMFTIVNFPGTFIIFTAGSQLNTWFYGLPLNNQLILTVAISSLVYFIIVAVIVAIIRLIRNAITAARSKPM